MGRQILADLGADVIKVERPGAGDDTRALGPAVSQGQIDGKPTGEAGYYLVGQSRQALDHDRLDKPEGQADRARLAARSDIVLRTSRSARSRATASTTKASKAINPRLIYCSITGFGQTGPQRDAAAYDFAIQAMGGLMSVTGERDDMPGGGPQKVGVPIVDIMTGMYAAVAVLAALARRDETGQGDTSISPCSTCKPRFWPTRR